MHTQGSYNESALGTAASAKGSKRSPRPTFLIACWVLALLAFAQLITIAAALTMEKRVASVPRTFISSERDTNREPIGTEITDEILATDSPSLHLAPDELDSKPDYESGTWSDVGVVTKSTQSPVTVTGSSSPSLSLSNDDSFIADPIVEKLIAESRALQLDGDMMRAMLKLDEAARLDPSEAAVIYNKGLLYEEMSLYTQAADQYQQVQQMGIVAGTFFKLAAKKLTKGMNAAHAHRPVISIGPMNVRRKTDALANKQVDLAITILARPDKSINPSDVTVQIHFYDKLEGGEIKKANANAKISDEQWDEKVDWKSASHEETVKISYTIPKADLAQAHLFGQREFFGYVVELYHQNKLIDQQAAPRRLNSIHSNHISPRYHQAHPWLPGDQNSLLPHKEEFDYGDDFALPRR